jgi:hypothetical protein
MLTPEPHRRGSGTAEPSMRAGGGAGNYGLHARIQEWRGRPPCIGEEPTRCRRAAAPPPNPRLGMVSRSGTDMTERKWEGVFYKMDRAVWWDA